MKFCEGSPYCKVCFAPHPKGRWQLCPCPLAGRKAEPNRQQSGLGDRIAQALEAIGVTKYRWGAVRKRLGLPSDCCSCEKRQKYLNQVGEELGQAARKTLEKLFGWVNKNTVE